MLVFEVVVAHPQNVSKLRTHSDRHTIQCMPTSGPTLRVCQEKILINYTDVFLFVLVAQNC